MKTPGDLVRGVAELSTRMKGGQYDLGGGSVLGGVNIDWNTTAVVDDGYAGVLVDGDGDFAAETAYGFIDGVVYDLVDEVMEPLGTGGPDVHCRAFPNWIEAFEDLD